MKTKLLKEVRKRFEIHRIDDVNRFASDFYKEAVEKFGIPFYQVVDTCQYMDYRTTLCKDKERAVEEIRKYIRIDYKRNKSNKKGYKSIKIWHV